MIKQRQGGIALLESLIALVVLAVGLLGAVGLQARAYSALSDASMRAEATIAAERLFGIMANDQKNLTSYAVASGAAPPTVLSAWHAQTKTQMIGDATTIAVTVTPTSDKDRTAVKVTIGWTRKDSGPANKHEMVSYIAVAS